MTVTAGVPEHMGTWGLVPTKFQTNQEHTVICKSLHTASVAKQVSVAVGWVKIKFLLMAQLKGLTAKFKLM